MNIKGLTADGSANYKHNEYLYNGKMFQDEMSLNWLDYGARFYDPVLGRFTGIYPIAEDYYHVTPYNYAESSPIVNIDLWGLQAFCIHGLDSKGADWKEPGFSNVKDMAMALTNNKKSFSSEFSWSSKFASRGKEQRQQAGKELAAFVKLNRADNEDITLIGVSDGGNVALQAASILFNELGIKVNIITINTPGSLDKNDPENPNENAGINDLIQISTKGDIVATALAGGVQNPGKNSEWQTLMVEPTVPTNKGNISVVTGIPGGGSVQNNAHRVNIPNTAVHATVKLNIEAIKNAKLRKLKPVK